MPTNLLEKYDLRLPRYTSYPTAPHFGPEVTAATYGGWLEELPAEQPLSLYLHIPFCDKLCWFCGCHTKITARYQPVADYAALLVREIELAAAHLSAPGAARHIHFGGGTPSILRPETFHGIIESISNNIGLASDLEVAVEIDPRVLTPDFVKALASAGVNRASLGVQDFNPRVQQAINRVQPFEITARAIDWLREAGIGHINLDLMYGLPLQTVEGVEAAVDRAATLKPSRVAVFGYAHVPWMKRHQRLIRDADLPATAERAAQFAAAAARLGDHGYRAIGLDHFALPDDELAMALDDGTLHRNFQGYTTDSASTLLGFGASSISQLPQGYTQNCTPLRHYARAVTAGTLATTRGLALSDDDRIRATIIERLMCDQGADLEALGQRFGFDGWDFQPELEALSDLASDGLVEIDGLRIAVTGAGRPFIRAVCAVFDRYLEEGGQRYSKAV